MKSWVSGGRLGTARTFFLAQPKRTSGARPRASRPTAIERRRTQCPGPGVACQSAAAASRPAALLLLDVSAGYDFVVAPCRPGASTAFMVKLLLGRDTRQRYRMSGRLRTARGPVPNHPERAHEEERECAVRHQELG